MLASTTWRAPTLVPDFAAVPSSVLAAVLTLELHGQIEVLTAE
jgi:hypothetical protein